MPDLLEELSLVGELQELVVLLRVSAEPHVIFVIHEDCVLRAEPLVTRPHATPGLEKLSVRIELQYGRRRNAALGLRWIERGGLLAIRDCRRTVKDPHVVVGIDGGPADLSVYPFVR